MDVNLNIELIVNFIYLHSLKELTRERMTSIFYLKIVLLNF